MGGSVCASICGPEKPVRKFQNVTECTYRIVYDFEDNFTEPQGDFPGFQLMTILKEGNVENMKALRSKKGKGIQTFGITQTISTEKVPGLVEMWMKRKQDNQKKIYDLEAKGADAKAISEEKEKYAAHPGDTAESLPFIRKRNDGTHALVHMWTVNIDEKFRERFTISEKNPSPKHFSNDAVKEVETAMVKLFGSQAANHKAKFAVAELHNKDPVYIGKASDLLKMLREHKEVCEAMNIKDVAEKHFVGEVVNFNWKTKEKKTSLKQFEMDLNTKYALYIKAGGDVMASVKPLDLFDMESKLGPEDHSFTPFTQV